MKNNRKKFIVKIFILIFLVGILYSTINIVIWYIDNKKNAIVQEELMESVKVIEKDDQEKTEDKDNEDEYVIDFESLKSINKDTVGYIKVNNTNINHIVVKTTDNKYYLTHNLKKEKNRSGWIFMDYRNKLDGTDKNIIIYGHNTTDGSMFGTLRRIITKDWYSNTDNYIIKLYLDGEEKKYQVFSTYSIPVEDYYITTNFKNNKEFKNFINVLTKRSVHKYNVNVQEIDHILTLSTCTGNGKKRMVLHAKEIIDES